MKNTRVINIEDINEKAKDMYAFVMECEEFYHDKILHTVSDVIQTADTKQIVFIAGPSGSAKTTTAKRITTQIENYNTPVLAISMDDFFLPILDRKGVKNFEDPACLNWELLIETINGLLEGQTISMPRYNFLYGTSECGPSVSLPRGGIIICEGIHALNSEIFDKFKGNCKGIYVAPRTRLRDGDGNILQPQELRLARRILRDSRTRGRNIHEITRQAISVDEGEQEYINPFKQKASIHIDTSLDYELCIIAKILEQKNLIEKMDEDSNLRFFLENISKSISTRCVPKNSILREFIG